MTTSFPNPAPISLNRFGRLAIATIISNLMVPLAGIIDTAFLGHLAEIHYLAGVALATVIFNVVYWSFGFLRMGTTGLVAQAEGRGDRSETFVILLRNGMVALSLGGLVLALQAPLRSLGFWLLSAEPEVQLSGEAFYNAQVWGAPAVLLNYVLLGYFLGRGQGRRVILLSLIGNGSNVFLDYWFIYPLGWASAGAGAATALSQGLMLAAGLLCLRGDLEIPALRQCWPQVWQPAALQGVFRLNRDIMIRTFAVVGSFALFTNWSAAMGTTVLAANTLLLQVVTLSAYFIDGIAFATESFAGQFHGASDRPRLRQLLILGSGWSLLIGVGIALAFALFPDVLFGLMTHHSAVLAQVRALVWWLLPTLTFAAIAFLLDGYFLGLTAGRTLRNSTLTAMTLGFLPMAILARGLAQPQLLWLAMTLFMALRAVTLAGAVPRSLWPRGDGA